MRFIIQTAFALLLVSNVSYAQSTTTDSFTYEAHALTLQDEGEKCQLSVTSPDGAIKRYGLDLHSPCYFLHSTGTQPKHFAYPQDGIKALFIILGNPLTADEQKIWRVKDASTCGTKGFGLYFDGQHFSLSKTSHDKMLLCRDRGVDEKVFNTLRD